MSECLVVYVYCLTHTYAAAAGTRQVVTGLAELKRRNAPLLCTSMCIGSGMGGAAIFVNEALR